MGNGCKCRHRIAKPTRSKSMNQISRNHKTGGLNFKYKTWAVSEGYFPPCFQCSRGSRMPSPGKRALMGWSRDFRRACGDPSSLCWSPGWSSHPPHPLIVPDHSAVPHCRESLPPPHLPAELPGRTAGPRHPSRCGGEQRPLAPGAIFLPRIGAAAVGLCFVPQTLIREGHLFKYSSKMYVAGATKPKQHCPR